MVTVCRLFLILMLFWLSEAGKIWGFQAFWSCSKNFPHYSDPLAEIGDIWGFWAFSGSFYELIHNHSHQLKSRPGLMTFYVVWVNDKFRAYLLLLFWWPVLKLEALCLPLQVTEYYIHIYILIIFKSLQSALFGGRTDRWMCLNQLCINVSDF